MLALQIVIKQNVIMKKTFNFYRKYWYSFISLVIIILGHSLVIIGGVHFSYFDEVLLWIIVITICIGINYIVNIRRHYLEKQNEIHSTMLYASNHIIRNLIYQTQLMRIEAMKIDEFNSKTIMHFDESIAEAEELLNRLSNIESLSKQSIYQSLKRPTNLTAGYIRYKSDLTALKKINNIKSTIVENQLKQQYSRKLNSSSCVKSKVFKISDINSCVLIFCISLMLFPLNAQIGIGTDSPHISSVLDISATNRGLLLPRVPLVSETDIVTITNPVHSLLVYNTSSTNDVTPGFYYWDSNIPKWVRLNNSSGIISAKFQNLGSDDNYCGSPTNLEIFRQTVWNDDPTIFVRNSSTELEITKPGKYRIVLHTYFTNSEDDENEYMAALHQVHVNGIPTGTIAITGAIEDEDSAHNTDGAVLIDTFILNSGDRIRIVSQGEDLSSSSEAECEFVSNGTSNVTITRIRDI